MTTNPKRKYPKGNKRSVKRELKEGLGLLESVDRAMPAIIEMMKAIPARTQDEEQP